MIQTKWMMFIAIVLLTMNCHVAQAKGEKQQSKQELKQNKKELKQSKSKGKKMVADASILSAPLYGKTINVIGDSYVKNHRRPYEEAWHYLVAEKYKMNYRNYGRNGRCLVFDRRAENWGEPMLEYYKEMNDSADYVLVIGGHNDADYIGRGKGTILQFEVGLDSLCRGLIAKYPTAKLAFVTPWRVPRAGFNEVIATMVKVCGKYSIPVFNAAERSGIYVWDEAFRKIYFQGPNDTAHLNAKGHQLFFRKGETFLLGL